VRIFISYGHDFTEEATMLAESLKSAGHDIWIDRENIISGSDWRNSITEAILSADLILVLLSKYGLRDDGVCLDELAIAVSCNRRNIRPVIMEKDLENMVPAYISGIQFFDMSDWRDIPADQFDEWYTEKFRLLENTSLKNPMAYEEKLQSLKNRLHVSTPFSRELFEISKGYKKRSWLDEKIESWLNDKNSNICLIVGFPGFGKSCYCANYYHYGNAAAGLIFCNRNKNQADGMISVIREVSFRFAVSIPSFATRLDRLLYDSPLRLDTEDIDDLFESLLIEPFVIIDGQMENILMILDGIDTFSHEGENKLASLFYENAERFPPYVKFLLTTRHDDSVLSGATDLHRILMNPDTPEIYNDIQSFVAESVHPLCSDKAESERIGSGIAEKAQGSFLYASAVSDGLKSGKISLHEVGILPNKIADVYFLWMKQLVPPKEFLEKYAYPVSLLVALENPPLNFLKKALVWRQSELQRFLHKFSVIFIKNIDKFGQTCVSFYCDSFAEWIKDASLSSIYCVSEEDGYETAAEYFSEAYSEEELSDYDYMNIVPILKKANKKRLLRTIARDDEFFDHSFTIVKKLQNDPEFFPEWSTILDDLLYLCGKRENGENLQSHIAFLRAKGEFICGDFVKCHDILDQNISLLNSHENDEDYLDCLYMFGTVCDLRGDRDRSIEIFQKLFAESEGKDATHTVKALAGLIWNDHYNDIDHGLKLLERLPSDDLDDNFITLKNLLTARMLLSLGNVDKALKLFDEVLNSQTSGLWGYDIVARKNQIFAIEAIVAAYDAGQYASAINFGEMICDKLRDTGSLAECYCLSWLALSYHKAGDLKQAAARLEKAWEVLGKDEAYSSKWLKMHLTSIEAMFLPRDEEAEKIIALYIEVERLAEECSDVWVRGDACFEIIALGFEIDLAGNENQIYQKNLFTLAEESQLPHLLYKASLVKLLYAEETEALDKIKDFVEIPVLPSTDVRQIAKLLLKKAIEIQSDTVEIYRKIIEKETSQ